MGKNKKERYIFSAQENMIYRGSTFREAKENIPEEYLIDCLFMLTYRVDEGVDIVTPIIYEDYLARHKKTDRYNYKIGYCLKDTPIDTILPKEISYDTYRDLAKGIATYRMYNYYDVENYDLSSHCYMYDLIEPEREDNPNFPQSEMQLMISSGFATVLTNKNFDAMIEFNDGSIAYNMIPGHDSPYCAKYIYLASGISGVYVRLTPKKYDKFRKLMEGYNLEVSIKRKTTNSRGTWDYTINTMKSYKGNNVSRNLELILAAPIYLETHSILTHEETLYLNMKFENYEFEEEVKCSKANTEDIDISKYLRIISELVDVIF